MLRYLYALQRLYTEIVLANGFVLIPEIVLEIQFCFNFTTMFT